MRDEVTRSAARRATLIAVPVALVTGALVFWLLGAAGRGSPGAPPTGSPRPAASGPVEMAAPTLAEPAATVCRALLSRLPDALGEQARRPVTAGAGQNAAYGDPPVTLACAAGPAPSLPAQTPVWALSGACWRTDERADATVWTTVDREVPITVTVPRSYRPPSQWVIDFSDPIIATVPAAGYVPTGCR